MTVKEIKTLAEFKEIIAQDRVAVFDFWATWCGPCRVISPVFEKLSEQEPFKNVDFYKVDVDDAPDISQECGIRAMPSFFAFKNGNKIDELVGANPGGLNTLLTKVAAA